MKGLEAYLLLSENELSELVNTDIYVLSWWYSNLCMDMLESHAVHLRSLQVNQLLLAIFDTVCLNQQWSF